MMHDTHAHPLTPLDKVLCLLFRQISIQWSRIILVVVGSAGALVLEVVIIVHEHRVTTQSVMVLAIGLSCACLAPVAILARSYAREMSVPLGDTVYLRTLLTRPGSLLALRGLLIANTACLIVVVTCAVIQLVHVFG